ncbi:MAG: ribose 5-phosphate isomerase B [Alphaproteobacteria bacterium]|nr:ribose 5-phosphate isomerase B [Alphaproteobacteria bacterium]
MKIALAADHAGYEIKNAIKDYLTQKNFEVSDLGTNSDKSVDYPLYADKVAAFVLSQKADLGILVCGTGIGISIRANRHKGIRAALLYSDEVAVMAKQHNNANVLVFGGRTMAIEDITRRIELFLNSQFEGERHQNRIDLLDK